MIRLAAHIGLVIAIFSAIVDVACAQGNDKTIRTLERLRQGMNYTQVRPILLNGGWQAILFPWHTAKERCGYRDSVCSKYQETASCSGTGYGFCRFEFIDTFGRKLFVITAGEDLAVNNWGLE